MFDEIPEKDDPKRYILSELRTVVPRPYRELLDGYSLHPEEQLDVVDELNILLAEGAIRRFEQDGQHFYYLSQDNPVL